MVVVVVVQCGHVVSVFLAGHVNSQVARHSRRVAAHVAAPARRPAAAAGHARLARLT